MLDDGFAAEVLEVRFPHSAGERRLVRKAVGMLQLHEFCHQLRKGGSLSLVGGKNWSILA